MATSAAQVLVIDDDSGIRDYISGLLPSSIHVLSAATAEEGNALLRSEEPDVVILDIGLVNRSGLDFCRSLRENAATRDLPVIIYTGAEDIESLTTAFESGADDFVAKTASPRELVARITAKLRRRKDRDLDAGFLRCGNLTLDVAKLEVRIENAQIRLSVLEFHLLRFFLMNRERVVSRTEILRGVWKDAVVSDRTIDTHMVYLRKKLVGFDHTLATVYGAGYILRELNAAVAQDTLEIRGRSLGSTG